MAKRKELQELLVVLKKEQKQAIDRYEKTKNDADEIERASAGTFSQAGDRVHSRGQADISYENLKRIKILIKEVKASLDERIDKIKPPCFVLLKGEGGELNEFFLVSSPVHLENIKLVSKASALGKKLLGKKVSNFITIDNSSFEVTLVN